VTAPQDERPRIVSVDSVKNAALIGTLVTEHFDGLMLTLVMHVHFDMHRADPVSEEERHRSRT
jgi:hypothetical protein